MGRTRAKQTGITMNFRSAILAGAAALGLSLFGMSGALAQVNDGTVDLAAETEGANNWLKVCDELDDGRRACIMRQVVLNNGVFTGSFLLRDDPGQESRLLAVAAVPLGVLLPFGLTWQIDGGREVRVPFMLCDPQSCAAQLVINEAYVETLKRGNWLTLTAKNRQNEDVVIRINLAGFTSAYDSADAMTIEQLTQANSPENVLDQVLQERAEQLRETLTGPETPVEGATPAPAP